MPDWPAEVARLNKVIRSLIGRAERSTSIHGSDFGEFQTAVMLEEQVRSRTAELEAALRENERVHRTLLESEARFRGIVDQSLVGIVLTVQGKFGYTNAKFNEMFGYTADEVRTLGPLDVVVESDRPLVCEAMRKRLSGEVEQLTFGFRGLRKNGATADIEIHAGSMEIDGKRALISVLVDVSERTRAEREVLALQEKLREKSTHDALTGLYNRHYLEEIMERELILAERQGLPVSVIMGDIDHFKLVNDQYGHLAGDEVLRVFGVLMKQHARSSDIYCRYGGEEFLLLMPGMTPGKAFARAEQLRCKLAATPVSHGDAHIAVSASFGVATFPHDGRTGDQLITAADKALYAAKAAGRNRVLASPGADDQESAGLRESPPGPVPAAA